MKLEFDRIPFRSIDAVEPVSRMIFLETARHFDEKANEEYQNSRRQKFLERNIYFPIMSDVLPRERRRQIRRKRFRAIENGFADGLAGAGLRILHEKPFTSSSRARLAQVVRKLESRSVRSGRFRFFDHPLGLKDGSVANTVNFGLLRGLPGILLFVSSCYVVGVEKRICRKIAADLAAFMLAMHEQYSEREFPRFLFADGTGPESPSCIQYGNLPVGYSLLLSGRRLNEESWERAGKELLKKTISKPVSQKMTCSPYVSSGASGFSLIADRAAEILNDPWFRDRAIAWQKAAVRIHKATSYAFEQRAFFNRDFKSTHPKGVATVLDSSLGVQLVGLHLERKAMAHWDSMIGFSNPVTGEII